MREPPPRLRELTSTLASARARLLSAVGSMDQAELDRVPGPDRWSVGEVLHHLQLIESSIARLAGRQAERAESQGIGADPGTGSMLGSLDAFGVEDSPEKVVAPQPFTPRKGLPRQALLDGLAESRAALLAGIDRLSPHDPGQLIFPHPVFGRINMYQWLLYVAQHELRHLHQIERSR